MPTTPARATVHQVLGRTLGTGPVLAVLTDGPADLIVAARAAELAARSQTLLIAAAAVQTSGISVNPLLHRARTRRIQSDSMAIVARVSPILSTAGVAYMRTTLAVPAGTDPTRALPVTAVHQLIDRFGAVAVITATALRDPTGVLHPTAHPAIAPTF
jgi:hypothetical protein